MSPAQTDAAEVLSPVGFRLRCTQRRPLWNFWTEELIKEVAMYLIREIMYCKPGQVKPMVQKFQMLARSRRAWASVRCAS